MASCYETFPEHQAKMDPWKLTQMQEISAKWPKIDTVIRPQAPVRSDEGLTLETSALATLRGG